jgi:hypothetical protein
LEEHSTVAHSKRSGGGGGQYWTDSENICNASLNTSHPPGKVCLDLFCFLVSNYWSAIKAKLSRPRCFDATQDPGIIRVNTVPNRRRFGLFMSSVVVNIHMFG